MIEIEFKEKYRAEPIFVRLFEIAMPHMWHYYSDLGHDTLGLAAAEVGDKFLWSYRSTGTWLAKITTNQKDRAMTWARVHDKSTPIENWHLIFVNDYGWTVREQPLLRVTKGFVIPLNLKSIAEVMEMWDNATTFIAGILNQKENANG